jgi:superfamily I DNA/RNA helicase
MNGSTDEKYQKAITERQKHVDAILASKAKKKIVVAGPGTGKTYLFKKLLEGKTNTLTLTFINSLVEDLSLELCGLSDVKTLHGFARSALSRTGKDVKVFPKLSDVIKEDARILLGKEIHFDRLFHTRDDESEYVTFYKRRKDYYDHYGYADIVFAIVKHFEIKKEKIPTYEQVVVDEFQDFNMLEVSLIELLAEKSPILLTGDDDQALYDFKDASPEHIRIRHGNENSGYAPFNLPFCSRCTRVIVDAANDVIANAIKNGLLKGRLKKPYHYFEDRKKDRESEQHPKVIYGRLFAKQVPWFIEKQLAEIAKEVRGPFSVLIISPTKVQSRDIVNALKEKGLERVETVETRGGNEPTLLDGLKSLLADRDCNLGWRIASKFFLKEGDFESLVKQSDSNGAKPVSEIIDSNVKKEILKVLKTLKAVMDGKTINEDDLDKVFTMVKIAPRQIAIGILRDELISSAQRTGNPSIRKIRVKATTIQSSKGLAAEYVFITHFDDLYFIKNKDKKIISDQEVCNFIVALTRAKRKVFLISTDGKMEPTFLQWIDRRRIDEFVFKSKSGE